LFYVLVCFVTISRKIYHRHGQCFPCVNFLSLEDVLLRSEWSQYCFLQVFAAQLFIFMECFPWRYYYRTSMVFPSSTSQYTVYVAYASYYITLARWNTSLGNLPSEEKLLHTSICPANYRKMMKLMDDHLMNMVDFSLGRTQEFIRFMVFLSLGSSFTKRRTVILMLTKYLQSAKTGPIARKPRQSVRQCLFYPDI
jgi:hypothetical protein